MPKLPPRWHDDLHFIHVEDGKVKVEFQAGGKMFPGAMVFQIDLAHHEADALWRHLRDATEYLGHRQGTDDEGARDPHEEMRLDQDREAETRAAWGDP